MRRYAHLALIPAVFMIFTEVETQPQGDHPILIDMHGADIRPATQMTKNANPRAMTEIRTARGAWHQVSTSFETVAKRLTDAAATTLPNQVVDARPPVDTTTPPVPVR